MKKVTAFLISLLATGALAQEIYINDAATLRQIQEIWINDAATLRQIQAVYINDGGVLRQVYSLYSYAISTLTEARSSNTGDVIVGFRLVNSSQAQSGDGNPTISWNNTISGEWQSPTDATQAALYEVEAVEFSRSDPGGNAIFSGTVGAGTWQGLGTTRTWTLTQPEDVVIFAEWVIDFTIRDISSQTTVATGKITLQATVI
ncbi:MAG: hypothetical protein E4H01_00505 [Lysobacterales bacterium]|nr:MAG: hypothetical protein E4H01_00505 [Xanthomonadales bacterium]